MQTIFQVDSFTAKPFGGNPAGVCILSAPRDEEWMQKVAAEMNVAETAFLLPQGLDWNLRWFSPMVEIDLCGHATLASAHVLYETGIAEAQDELYFHTRSGVLRASCAGSRIILDFPAQPATEIDPQMVREAMAGFDVRWSGRNRMDYLVEVADAEQVRQRTPDARALPGGDVRGLIVTAKSDDPTYDFISRFFAPAVGIDEDPVTGSAHCALGPYWMNHLGKSKLTGYQASKRGGIVGVEVQGERVKLLGQAITVLRGELFA
jgi:predicted PhzF superfamily epimerase YddE/YHI9